MFFARNQSRRVFGGGAGSESGRDSPDPLPAAGPMACGGLWAMIVVDTSSSAVLIHVAHTWVAPRRRACGVCGGLWAMPEVDTNSSAVVIYVAHT